MYHIFNGIFFNINLIYFVDLTWAHGPAWQTKRGLLHVEIAEQNLRVLLNHPFICRAPRLQLFPFFLAVTHDE